ncbi:hypothetical protein QJS10_CPB22g00367 [Acorus calamus]|uniref:Uncharacterized protein n=1 Tax=Acorus calamus TaxID=4465 RepID=A0AAV9C0Q7_ACOCL|nr:hypothetical protein QJS10_CPB22g00367 [Acorus calamus]
MTESLNQDTGFIGPVRKVMESTAGSIYAASAKKQAAPAESNEANLDLSLGLKSHEGDRETDSKLKK